MSCETVSEDPFRCPTKWELWRQILALLPRGRAWQTHDVSRIPSGAESAQLGSYELGSTSMGSDPTVPKLTVLQQYWAAYAEVLEYLHQRACALLDEFFCSSAAETRAEWGAEYGYPDACEPWETLCDKVRATGGSTCAYLVSIAARVGYVVECTDCEAAVTADCGIANLDAVCPCVPNQIRIRIFTALSPAATAATPFAANAAVADCTAPCAAPPAAVVCIIERFKPAHVRAIYEVV
jgi:uncharacterized protein YmfQ (DUF2313 family)